MALQKRPYTHRLQRRPLRTLRHRPVRSPRLHTPDDPARSAEHQLAQQYREKYGPQEANRRLARRNGYHDVPPTITQFLNDPYFFQPFLGLAPDGSSKWRDYWWAALRTIYPNPYAFPFLEIVLTGCIGAGKSTCGLAGMAYDICHLLHMRSPQNFYGDIGDATRIVFALFNTTKTRAESVLYDQLITGFVRQQINTRCPRRVINCGGKGRCSQTVAGEILDRDEIESANKLLADGVRGGALLVLDLRGATRGIVPRLPPPAAPLAAAGQAPAGDAPFARGTAPGTAGGHLFSC